jgi:hypothetical protein
VQCRPVKNCFSDKIAKYLQETAFITGQLADMEVRMRRFDGEYRSFLLRASPMCAPIFGVEPIMFT